MALPKRIVHPDPRTGLHGQPGAFIRHAGQRFLLHERALTSQRIWVYVRDAPNSSPGLVPDLLLYERADYHSRIIGRAEPTNR